MDDVMLQIWGGLCYLLNKICFSRAERSRTGAGRKQWRVRSWGVYLAGLPAWVAVFLSKHDWIAAGVESGGAPAMLAGLLIALRGRGAEPRWLDMVSKLAVVLGLALSVYEFGGINTLGQFLELGIAAGFLLGTYLAAHNQAQGYLWLMLGNLSCAALMGRQGFSILMVQQLLSLAFVVDAYAVRRGKRAV